MSIDLPAPVARSLRAAAPQADLLAVLEHSAGAMRFALDKVFAHTVDGSRFPLPNSADSPERRLLANVRALPTSSRTATAQAAVRRLTAAPTTRKRTYGSVTAMLDPSGDEPVVSVLRRAAVPASVRTAAERAVRQLRVPEGSGRVPGVALRRAETDRRPLDRAPQLVPQRLRLVVSEVHAKDKNEILRDEIAIATVVMDPVNQTTRRSGPTSLGKFKRGERKQPGTVIVDVPLRGDALSGQFFLANVFLAEIDLGGFAEYVTENEHVLSAEMTENLVLVGLGAAGAIMGGSAGAALASGLLLASTAGLGPIAGATLGIMGGIVATVGLALLGAAAAMLVGYAVMTAAQDDIFSAATVGQTVDADGTLLLGQPSPLVFTQRGATYVVKLRWEIVRGAGTPAAPAPPPFGRVDRVTDKAIADRNLRDKVDHVVVLMLENRSFDHMLGYLSLVGGRPEVKGLHPGLENVLTKVDPPESYAPLPYPDSTFSEDPAHHIAAVLRQIADGEMTGFVDDFYRLNATDPGKVMGFHPADQVPVYDFIAREFLICDGYHCSFPGNTWVNRTISLTGRMAQKAESAEVITNNDKPVLVGASVPSLFRHLDAFNATLRPDEQRADWRFYSQDVPTLPIIDLQYAPQVLNPTDSSPFRSMDRFFRDLADGTLPAVSWLDPNFMDLAQLGEAAFVPDDGIAFPGAPHHANDDHPPVDLAHGQALVASILFAMMGSPVWDKLLFVITYDEHGGFYDHIPPPKLADLGLEPETDAFSTLGCRVPTLVVSPWVERGSVSDHLLDHCSIVKTIVERFCSRDGSAPFVSDRVDKADHLGHVLTGTSPRFTRSTRRAGGRPRPAATNGTLTPRMRDDLLRSVGKRMMLAGARPRVNRPPTDMEKDIAEAREHFVARRARV